MSTWSSPALPTGTLTFLFTDAEGSSEPQESHPQLMRAAMARHDALLTQVFAQHDGVAVRPRGEWRLTLCGLRARLRRCSRRFDMAVGDVPDVLTEGLPERFDVGNEPHVIEVQDPDTTRLLLTAEHGPDAVSPAIGTIYERDTSLMPDGKTHVLGCTRPIGDGGVTYIGLGHCHNPTNNGPASVDRSVDLENRTPLTFRNPWGRAPFQTLLRNAIRWRMRGQIGTQRLFSARTHGHPTSDYTERESADRERIAGPRAVRR
jgi:hypothetical protein